MAHDIDHIDIKGWSEVETGLDRTLTVVGGGNFAIDRDCGRG